MAKQEAVVEYASMDPDDFSQGGGLFDDVDAVITKAEFTPDPPNENYTSEGNPLFFVLGIQIDGADESVEQSYAMGSKAGDNFDIADDKAALKPLNGAASKLSASSKFGTFMAALKTANFDTSTLGGPGGSMANLVGVRAHFNRIADAVRTGLKNQKEKKYPETTLVITKIHEAAAAAGKGKKAAAGAAPAAAGKKATAPAAGNVTQEAEEVLVGILAANGGEVQKGKLPLLATRALNGNANKVEINKLIASDAFLSREGAAYEFDKSVNPPVVRLAA